jgi:hypothetical protein
VLFSDKKLSELLVTRVLGYKEAFTSLNGVTVWANGLSFYEGISFDHPHIWAEAFIKMIEDGFSPSIGRYDYGTECFAMKENADFFMHVDSSIGKAVAIVALQAYGIEIYGTEKE